jgi:hypothetical protein
MKQTDIDDILEKLFAGLVDTLSDQVQDPECNASTLNVARQFLKDHGFKAHDNSEQSGLGKLAAVLPFKTGDDERFG